MIRLRTVVSDRLDQDAESHLAMLETLPRVQVSRYDRPVTDELALILRDAVKLLRREEADVVVTAGEPALVATLLSWRGPHIHLANGHLTRVEERLLRWRRPPSRTLCVFSSRQVAADAVQRGIDRAATRLIRCLPPPLFATREQVREKLGIARDATCLLLCGRIRHIGDQHMTLWAGGILGFRDPNWRVLIDPGVHSDYVYRHARSTSQPGVTVLAGECSASEIAVAADVAIIDPSTPPSLTAIASAAAQRVPLVASPAMWARERLSHVPAILVDENKPRRWAKAVIESVEGAQANDLDRLAHAFEPEANEKTLVHQWLEMLHETCGRPNNALVA